MGGTAQTPEFLSVSRARQWAKEVAMRTSCRKALAVLLVAGLVVLAMGSSVRAAQKGKGPLKVFILAGQSNMQGHGAVNTLDWLGEDPTYGKLLGKIKNKDGSWKVRDDVWIWYMGRRGNLTTGYGVPRGPHGPYIGPELGFGTVIGDYLEAQVLLIKIAWGGRALATDFLPPSAGGPGRSYSEMLKHVRDVLGKLKEHFPDYNGRGYEIAGFLWFQGWNDMINRERTAKYTRNLEHFIKDLRKELKVPKLPFVVGELGVGGPKRRGAFQKAQAAIEDVPEFKGNVRFVKTAEYWDQKADELYRKGVWRGPEKDKFYKIASHRPYHYLGSGKIMFLMGHAFGEGMAELLGLKKKAATERK